MLAEKVMQSSYHYIRKYYGIELLWTEKAALSYYLTCFNNKRQIEEIDNEIGSASFNPSMEYLNRFMHDYFGLDEIVLGQDITIINDMGKNVGEFHGLTVLGTESFKEYCRRKVNQWREERTFP